MVSKERNSSMELLRIIAMLLVLVVHASFKSLGVPTQGDIIEFPLSSFLRFFSESASIICVNSFILISGWFGIRPKMVRFCEFLFQTLFFGVFVYLSLLTLGITEKWGIRDWGMLLTFRRGLWFVNSYIILYIFAPILNSFVENASRQLFQKVLIAFFVIQTFLGFLHEEILFHDGFSPLSFMGLYLLARYAKLYPTKFTTQNKHYDMGIYLVITLMTTLLALSVVRFTGQGGWVFYTYTSPLVILGSFYFFLFFTKLSFHSKVVNWIAGSAFAVYLLHVDPLIFQPHYLDPIKEWYSSESLLPFLGYTTMLIIAAFVISILIDKIRLFIWSLALKITDKSH